MAEAPISTFYLLLIFSDNGTHSRARCSEESKSACLESNVSEIGREIKRSSKSVNRSLNKLLAKSFLRTESKRHIDRRCKRNKREDCEDN